VKINNILSDKSLKPAEKTGAISKLLIDKSLSIKDLIELAKLSKDPEKATCIEAIEYTTGKNPAIIDSECFEFITGCLTEKAPRIKWESARVIGNTCHLFPDQIEKAVINLLVNTKHPGTVVRWSAAFALGQIIKMKTDRNKTVIPEVESIITGEEKNSIRKIYQDAIKKAGK
jgi:hypothetical protein